MAAGGLEMEPTIAAVEQALRLEAIGDAVLPPKVSINWGEGIDSDEREGRIMVMPAYVGGDLRVAGCACRLLNAGRMRITLVPLVAGVACDLGMGRGWKDD